jgi:magnesium transporter
MALTKTPLLAETVRKLVSRGASANAHRILEKLHPADVAQVLADLPEAYRLKTFRVVFRRDLNLAAAALSELGVERSATLVPRLEPAEISQLLQELDPDDAAEFLSELPEELREEVLGGMRSREASDVEDLLQYPEQTAGRIMSPKVFSVPEDTTIGETIKRLQESPDVEMVFYIYVVDGHGTLVGVLSLRQLLQRRPEALLSEVMVTDVLRVRTEMDQEEVAQLVASYNILAVPVVNQQGKLVGVITVDDIIDVIKEEATEDMYRMAGLGVSESVFTKAPRSIRMRMPWLAVNLATAFLAAWVVSLFEAAIARFAILAVFMPMVPLLGGNAGNQTLTVMVRGIALGELSWKNSRQALLKELAVGSANGLVIGLLIAGVSWLWKGDPRIGLALALAMVGTMLVAAIVGTLMPLTLRWLKVDPALASSVFVTTATDVAGFLLFLSIGVTALTHL